MPFRPSAQIAALLGHTDTVNAIALSSNELVAVSASSDGTLIVWDLTTFAQTHTLRGHHAEVTAVVVTADGKRGFSASGRQRSTSNLSIAHSDDVPSGDRQDNSIRAWDLLNGVETQTFVTESPVRSLYLPSTEKAL